MIDARLRHLSSLSPAAVRPHRPDRPRADAIAAGTIALLLTACVPAAPPPPAAAPLGSETAAQPSSRAANAEVSQRPASLSGTVDQETGVQVVGVGVVLATPDLARIVVGVERLDAALDRALSSAASDMD